MFVFLIKIPDICFYKNDNPVTYKVTGHNILSNKQISKNTSVHLINLFVRMFHKISLCHLHG